MTFSIIIPTYNRKHLLLNAVKSVLSQTYQNYEIIIADDASNYNVKDWIHQHFNTKNICVITNPQNSGPANTRNAGLATAGGDFVAFLDDDDMWLPDHLMQLQKCIIDHPHGIVYFSNGERVHYDTMKTISKQQGNFTINPTQYYFENPVLTSSVAIRNSEIKKTSLKFEESLRYPEDYLFWMCVSAHTAWYGTGKVTVRYFIYEHAQNLTSQNTDFIAAQRLKMLEKLNEFYANDHTYNRIYKKIAQRGVYFKISREYLNHGYYHKALEYIMKIARKQPLSIFTTCYLYVCARWVYTGLKFIIFKKKCCN